MTVIERWKYNESIDLSMSSLSSITAKKISGLILLILLLVGGYLLFTTVAPKTVAVKIVNSSNAYHLTYDETDGFIKFLKEMAEQDTSNKGPTKSKIEEINIRINDQEIPQQQIGVPIVPISVNVDNTTETLRNLKTTIIIDPAQAQSFSENDLTSSLFTSIVGQIYIITHPSLPIEERVNAINDIAKQLYESNSNPFILIKK